jgi:penicillin-binding protein 1A
MIINVDEEKNVGIKKPKKTRKLSVYSNLSHNRKNKKDAELRKRAEYLASLPKNPVKRFFYRLKPKNFFGYWFSKRGLIMFGKIVGVTALLCVLFVGGLFAYFRKDLDSISPSELSKQVQSNVTTYLDRNGKVLWVDKGDGDYKLVVKSEEICDYLKKATVAIEDKYFYTEGGVSIPGLMRAVVNNITGGSTQGGSTLTQQLVKQVFFADEANLRGINGIPRKIKEMILAIEVERMYSKDQILTLYLNESPYGGRRNGVESAAQTYFGKSAKDLNLAESALLAAIPQNPSVFNPYNIDGHAQLIERQHTILDYMVEQGYIDQAAADEAKAYPIIDSIVPESDQYKNIKAPHFVQMVRDQLEKELGETTLGNGGLTVTTTLDLDIQTKLEEAMNNMFSSYLPDYAGFSNGAATVEDTQTGQIVALLGSRDFNYAGFGQDNAAVAYIQPGSTIKPLVYSQLFEEKSNGVNYGSGSILNDVNIDSLYGAKLYNADHKFKGPLTIRYSLANSRNVPAVTAMYISGVKNTLDIIHSLGATSYCTQGDEVNVGLAAAIGGCGVRQIDLVNSYATLARQGAYKPQSTILKVTNTANETLLQWKDAESVQIVSAQSAYIVSDILSDDVARADLDGRHALGFEIDGVKTATKTGTSDKGGYAKDIWMVSYSPALTMAVWLGNSDATILKQGTSSIPGVIVDSVMSYAHTEVYAKQGKYTAYDWYSKPTGIQTVGGEVYPSWWGPTQGKTKTTLKFDKVSKKKATDCTPASAIVELEVTKTVDVITKKDVYTATDITYDATADDNVHKCSDAVPGVSVNAKPGSVNGTYDITATVTKGTFEISSVDIAINGTVVKTITGNGPYTYSYTMAQGTTTDQTITATATDTGLYTASGTTTIKYTAAP